ncbi:MAG: PAS domain S-box protein [Bacteroidetes bacterium]|nr:PAS domain S-box protein [Bacteroidota bacterium]
MLTGDSLQLVPSDPEISLIKRVNELEIQNEELRKQLAKHTYSKTVQQEFAGGFLTHTIGKDFFNLLTQYLAKALPVDYVLIGEIQSDATEEDCKVKTIAFSSFGKLVDNIEYSLPGEPCEQIIRSAFYSYPRQCKKVFPNSHFVTHYNIEGYIGCPLFNSQNKSIGLIAVLNQDVITEVEHTETLLKIVAKRAELEMERLNYEQVLKKSNDQLHKKIQAQFDELLKERQMLHNFFMQAPAILAIFRGPEHIFELANPPFTQLFGSRYLLGKTAREALSELEEQTFFDILDTVYSTGESYVGTEIPTMVYRETGIKEKGYFNFIYQVFTDKRGETDGILFFAVEVTQQVFARKQMEQNTAMLQKLYMQTPAIICTLSGPNHVYDLINPSYQKLFGKRELLGKKIIDAIPELKEQGLIELLDQVYKTGESFVGNDMLLLLLHEEDTTPIPRYFNFSYQPLYNENNVISGILIFGYEVTDQVMARKKVEESAERIRIIGEVMPQKVWTACPEGNINYLNQRWLDYTGKSFDELKDLGWQTVIHPDDLDKLQESWQYSIDTGNAFELEHRIMQNDGTYHWHLTRGIAQKNKSGKTLLWIGTNTDIDEQKLAEEATKKNQVYTRSLIEASLDPLITISPEGKITDVNEATEEITGLPREKLIGTHFFYHFTDPVKASKGYQKVFSKGFVADYPLTIRHKKGKLTPVLFNGSIYKDEKGKVLGSVVIARDITQLIHNEQELLQAKTNAEHAAEIAKEAVNAKQQFLSTMSHEIRTPMNAILGFTQIMQKTQLDHNQKEYLTAIQTSGDTLLMLINDILDLAKIEAGKMSFEQIPFKLDESITAILHTFEIKMEEKKLELTKYYDDSIPEILLGDPTRLHQIILNLISNAIKFTPQGSIAIDVSLINQNAKTATIQFSIKDTGIGIPEDKMENIFENFEQANSDTARNYGGTGLGLAIVKKLVEGQGGTLSVKSVLNEGSVFTFTLPLMKTEGIQYTEEYNSLVKIEESETNYGNSTFDTSSIKVLVVEDNRLNQFLMTKLLKGLGYQHDIAGNGKIAIEKLEHNNYDLILMDLQMPEMNGLETTNYIRTQLNSKIPIIVLTADVTNMDENKCKAAGMNDYIAKPVNEKLLNDKIVKILNVPITQ